MGRHGRHQRDFSDWGNTRSLAPRAALEHWLSDKADVGLNHKQKRQRKDHNLKTRTKEARETHTLKKTHEKVTMTEGRESLDGETGNSNFQGVG